MKIYTEFGSCLKSDTSQKKWYKFIPLTFGIIFSFEKYFFARYESKVLKGFHLCTISAHFLYWNVFFTFYRP